MADAGVGGPSIGGVIPPAFPLNLVFFPQKTAPHTHISSLGPRHSPEACSWLSWGEEEGNAPLCATFMGFFSPFLAHFGGQEGVSRGGGGLP